MVSLYKDVRLYTINNMARTESTYDKTSSRLSAWYIKYMLKVIIAKAMV
jgi:hypothetical protein